jgi:PAS domain S-box-containing protein
MGEEEIMKPKALADPSPGETALRQHAEATCKLTRANVSAMSPEEVQRLVHELQVHQVELETQNEELRGIQLDLKDSRDQYSNLYEFAPVGYVTVDPLGKIIMTNMTACSLLGTERKQIVGTLLSHFIAPSSQDAYLRYNREAFEASAKTECLCVMNRDDGKDLHVRLQNTPIHDENGELVQSRMVLVDLTELKQSEQHITELNTIRKEQESVANDLTQLIDTANAPIFGIDAAGLVNEWNQRAEVLTGFDKADVMGKDLVGGFITDDYKASVKAVLDKALKGEESANYEFPLFSKSGDRVDVLLNSTSRRDSNGNIVGVVGVGQDITELKHAQEQVIQASKLATLGEMATSVAHELNQPLNVIRIAAGNSRRKISKGTADLEYLNNKLERIEGQTARAAAIIDHMKMFGRKAGEKPEQIDLRQAVTNALDLMGEQLRLAGIEIVTEFPDTCSLILGHTIQLEQVILNLLTNARDAMAKNCNARDGETKITLRVFEDENGVHVSSQDTGGGIPEEVIPRIFEPFYTTKEMGKGTGLGLSVSYGIIREMNGTIIAENIEDGARFTIACPAAT